MSKNEVKPVDNESGKKPTNKFLDPEYKGEPLNDKLKDGPVMDRGCTDCLCCIIFTSFAITWIVIGIYGFANGDPIKLTYPFDSYEDQCGEPGGAAESYPYVYYPFPFPLGSFMDYRVCLKSCPSSTSTSGTAECYKNIDGTLVEGDCTFKCSDVPNSSSLCDTYDFIKGTYETTDYLSRFCLPGSSLTGDLKDAYDDVVNSIGVNYFREWISDLYSVWVVLLIVAGATLGYAAVYMIFLRYCVGFIVWLSIFVTIGFVVVLAAFFQWAAYNLYDENTDPNTVRNLKILAYVLYAVAGLLLLYIFYMCNKIRLAIAIMKVGTQYIADVWQALLVPPACFLLVVGLYIYWVLSLLYIYSSGTITMRSGSSPFADADFTTKERGMFYFEFWGILWMNAFLLALGQFVLASSVCIWYFSVNSDSGPQRPISRSIWRAFRYHLGSLAFGSLILAIVWTIKYVLMYIQNRIKQTGATQNSKVVEWFLRILMCYVLCFERIIKFLNKNAYIQIALNATNFCTACKDAFFLILRNAARFLAVGSIGAVFMFLGKWVITFAATYTGYMIITRASKWKDEIHSPIFPTVVFFLIAYVISGLFMSVYGMACDTILQCFLADEELCAKDRGAPSHSPEILADFMGRERQKDQSARCCDCC